MHDAAARTAIRTFLREMAVTLQKASGVAKAADFFAQRGDIRKGTEIALEWSSSPMRRPRPWMRFGY